MKKRIAIVGGGFGGLSAAKLLAGRNECEVLLFDQRNHHLFQPLLYQVATAGLSPSDIAAPIRSILSRSKNVQVILSKIESVDLKAHALQSGELSWKYDSLILACGTVQSYFGHNNWEENAPGLKTLEQATEIRRRILLAFELAEKEPDPDKQKELLSFVVVGGGPTGVELAGSIAEISRYTLSRDFRKIDPSSTRIILIEGGPRILPTFAEPLSKRATRDLEGLGVQIWTRTRVVGISASEVRVGSEILKATTILWAAGVGPNSMNAMLGVPLDSAGRILVTKDLSIADHPNVFVIGDQAHCPGADGKPLPGLAPVAMQQGRHVARTLIRDLSQLPRLPFQYADKGQMATLGRRRAVVQVAGFHFAGFFAWLTWLFVHIYYLIGFKNRVFVFYQWAWSYFTLQRGSRLIVDKEWRLYSHRE